MADKQIAEVGVEVLVMLDEEVLLLRRADTEPYSGLYGLPSGSVEGFETPKQAAGKKVMEYLGLDVEDSKFTSAITVHRRSKTGVNIDFFLILDNVDEDKVKNNNPDKCDELKWFHIHNIPEDDMIPYIKDVISSYKNWNNYLEDHTSYLNMRTTPLKIV